MNQAFPGGLQLFVLKAPVAMLPGLAASYNPTAGVQPSGNRAHKDSWAFPPWLIEVLTESPSFLAETPKVSMQGADSLRLESCCYRSSRGAYLQLVVPMRERRKQNGHRLVKICPAYTTYPGGETCLISQQPSSRHASKPTQLTPSVHPSLPKLLSLSSLRTSARSLLR